MSDETPIWLIRLECINNEICDLESRLAGLRLQKKEMESFYFPLGIPEEIEQSPDEDLKFDPV